ncbi:MAG: hypothetical protein WA783_01215 [Phormidesmis sp.]
MAQSVYQFCFNMAVCVASGVAISGIALETLPAEAASFSFSGSRLTLDTLNALPQTKASMLDTDAIAQTQRGTANNFFDGTLDFVADETTRLNSGFEARSLGDGSGYFGQAQITSYALADFFVTPDQPFSLNFQFATRLQNQVGAAFERATARSMLSLSLLDQSQSVLKFFTLDASVNTSPIDQQTNESLLMSTNAQIFGNSRQLLPGANQEIGNISFAGGFTHSVSQPTLLTLQVDTLNQSCVQAPNTQETCVKVPDSSGALSFAVVTALGLVFVPKLRQ